MKRTSPIVLLGLAFIVFATLACMCSIFNTRKPLVITPGELPDAQAGSPYEATFVVSQNETPVGGLSVSAGSLPPGLELDYVQGQSAARISGTPQQGGILRLHPLHLVLRDEHLRANGGISDEHYREADSRGRCAGVQPGRTAGFPRR